MAESLIARARQLYAADAMPGGLEQTVYAFDATTIDLCLSLFPWASFRRHKGTLKLRKHIDRRSNIPCLIRVRTGKQHDVNALERPVIEPGAFYVMDRGYFDLVRLYRFEQSKAFFVIRAKKNLNFKARESRPVDKTTGLLCDQTIELRGNRAAKDDPQRVRRVRFTDPATGKKPVLLTNCFLLGPLTISQLYKARWQVELFFKWSKQHLRIKAFYGNSPNAVKSQVWIAVCVYVLVAILAREQAVARKPSEILQIPGIMFFWKVTLKQALTADYAEVPKGDAHHQLSLFNF